jgi:hypothetical protein
LKWVKSLVCNVVAYVAYAHGITIGRCADDSSDSDAATRTGGIFA